ncbi:MAG: hypothetical protein GY904_15300 [Planctomycetaceae bacterium]|nr:hypothetical protein [Planctomycetaceae bacterium]
MRLVDSVAVAVAVATNPRAMISCIRASGTNQPGILGVNGFAASSLTTVLSAGITMTRVAQAQSVIKHSVDANLVTVRNSRVDCVQRVFELFAFILGFL